MEGNSLLEVDSPPKRVVYRSSVEHELEDVAIIERFFASYGSEPFDDYYSHLMAPNESSKMHIVLDLRCKTNPVVDLHAIAYEVYRVKKRGELLNSSACDVARQRCKTLTWGTDRRFIEGFGGDRPEQVGHSPSRLTY
ncbi:hypothetical protein BU16DRAFT_232107 [Lophium mytilinum]|uniref:Uncharacterized protein n=1 Tax=Lophium mytilinum TaxID=390894 RepID=A0A6A6R5E1_9PEZI|nr:hypothetical protein BU16DRAFT_232107 [Lophium mytilinum]